MPTEQTTYSLQRSVKIALFFKQLSWLWLVEHSLAGQTPVQGRVSWGLVTGERFFLPPLCIFCIICIVVYEINRSGVYFVLVVLVSFLIT